jgi:hypothetical protein
MKPSPSPSPSVKIAPLYLLPVKSYLDNRKVSVVSERIVQ